MTPRAGKRAILKIAERLAVNETAQQQGLWMNDGQQAVWRYRVASSDAKGMSFSLSLPQWDAQMQVRVVETENPANAIVLNPNDYKGHVKVRSPFLPGKDFVLEVSVPASAQAQTDVKVDAVNVYPSLREPKVLQKTASGTCEIDVVCSSANGQAWIDAYRNQIRSVGMLEFEAEDENGDLAVYACSGTLMNNTKQDRTPYLLTANHCISRTAEAQSTIVYWNYQSPVCRTVGSAANGNPIDYSTFPTSTGTTIVSTWSNEVDANDNYIGSDFTLLKLDQAPSSSLKLYFAGWEKRTFMPLSAVGIHHAYGEEKRISAENDAPVQVSFSDNIPANAYMEVGAWDKGVTEVGSSGSALFNQAQRVVGTLSFGDSGCDAGADIVTGPDYYGRLAIHWTGGGTAATRLKDWLDPLNTNPNNMDGIEATATAIDEDTPLPDRHVLTSIFPNPFTPNTVLTMQSDRTEYVKVRLYSITGALVRELYAGVLAGQQMETVALGDLKIANGVYLVQVKGESFSQTERFVKR